MRIVASVDIGTYTSRLGIAQITDGHLNIIKRVSVITNLGDRVDATGKFNNQAIERVVDACAQFVNLIHEFNVEATCTTLTSAARDAKNVEMLLEKLRNLGLKPQVIAGETEARLTFLGVASDFVSEKIAVVDSGGGSTEIAIGSLKINDDVDSNNAKLENQKLQVPTLQLDCVHSFNIGARRMTERYFEGREVVSEKDISQMRQDIYPLFKKYFSRVDAMPSRMIFVGGTITSLASIDLEMVPYDSSKIHLYEFTHEGIQRCLDRFSGKTVEQIAKLPGIQQKRAPIIQGGAIIIDEILHAANMSNLTISENGLITGVVLTIIQNLNQNLTSIGWLPELS